MRRPEMSIRSRWSGGLLERGDDRVEGLGIVDRDVRERLPVDLDLRLLELAHEDAVREPARADGGAHARDPETTEVALAEPAARERHVLRAAHDLHDGLPEPVATAPVT